MPGNGPVSGNASMTPCCCTCGNMTRFKGTAPVSTRPFVPSPPLGRHHTGSNPTDSGKLGCKHHLLVDQRGLPLVANISGVQVYDSRLLIPLLEAAPFLVGLAGWLRKRPAKLHADKAYSSRTHRAWLRSRCIAPHIARYGIESCDRLVDRRPGWNVSGNSRQAQPVRST
ncbi:transposase [Janthinobacterium lividum]|uniref:transposase n=1 Tax=Janthinobacterium lividum TaxID=29581 RepID=UPI000FE1D949